MNIELVPIENKYRGIDRILNSAHFNINEYYNKILNMYFDYLNMDLNNILLNSKEFEKICCFYKQFKQYGIKCELIAFDNHPIYKNEVHFLGIDIVNEYFESVLLDENYIRSNKFALNNNGLFTNFKDAEKMLETIPNDEAGHKLNPYYVYKMRLVK